MSRNYEYLTTYIGVLLVGVRILIRLLHPRVFCCRNYWRLSYGLWLALVCLFYLGDTFVLITVFM